VYGKVRRGISEYVIERLQGGPLLGIVPQRGQNVPQEHRYPVVEVDESLFTHLTEEGHREQIWVVGIYDGGTEDVRMFFVENRQANTLLDLIEENVDANAVIYTDGWRAYAGLGNRGYEHRVVIHELGFGAGLDTTNGIESCWSQVKRLSDYYRGIQGRGEFAREQIQDYVNHGVWLRHVGNGNMLEALTEIINYHYNLN